MRIQRLILLLLLLLIGCGAAGVEEDPTPLPTAEPTVAPTNTAEPVAEATEVEPTAIPVEVSTDASEEGAEVGADRTELLAPLAPEGTEIWPASPERGHDENVTYPFGGNPLPGGIHHPVWQKCGVYYAPLYTQLAIHAMEHGAVWITYNPETVVGANVAVIASYATDQPFVLISPFPEQDSPIAVTAWGIQLLVDEPDDERIQQFVEAFANGPQNPEPGADCSQGITETISNS